MSRLHSLGLCQPLLAQLSLSDLETLSLGRVCFEAHAHCVIAVEDGDVPAQLHPTLRDREDRVVVGDWVLVDRRTDPPFVVRRLDRLRAISRGDPYGDGRGPQVLCANVDVVWIATSLDRDLNVRRLQRYLALAFDSDCEPVVALTKCDQAAPEVVATTVARLVEDLRGVRVLPVSGTTGLGVPELVATVGSGRTAALLGSSGVGKSTLMNWIRGGESERVGPVREDDQRGRHTTTARRLLEMPQGGWLVDNPGMRRIDLVGDGGIALVFDEIDLITRRCKFRDCGHDTEPGCALRAAQEAGEVDEERLAAWRKLQRQLLFEATRTDANLRRRVHATWRRRTKAARERSRVKL